MFVTFGIGQQIGNVATMNLPYGPIITTIPGNVLPDLTNWKFLIVAKSSILTTSNPTTYDSFDGNNGPYNQSTHRSNAHLICSSSATGSINISNNSVIYGFIGEQQDANSSSVVVLGVNGSVGDLNWIGNNNNGIQPGHFLNNSFQETIASGKFAGQLYLPNSVFDLPIAPFTSGVAIKNADTTLTSSIDYSTAGFSSNLNVSASNCRLYVAGNFNPSSLNVVNTGSIKIYVSGSSTSIGTITSPRASTCKLYYLIPNLTHSFSNTNNTVCIEAQQSSVGFTGGGTGDFTGYIIADSLKTLTRTNFHMDETIYRI